MNWAGPVIAIVLLGVVMVMWVRDGPLTGLAVRDVVEEDGSIEVLFTHTHDVRAAFLSRLVAAQEVLCALYEVNDPAVAAALEPALLITDSDSDVPGDWVDRGPGLMHDKFCVLGGDAVWTGSLNPTLNGFDRNDNNVVVLQSRTLAENYRDEFGELREAVEDNDNVQRPVRHPRVRLSGVLVENYFCPEDRCEAQVLRALRLANRSIRFMAYSFTSDPIGELLVRKAAEGVEVAGVFEKKGQSDYSEYRRLESAGLNVTLDGNPASMHHKVFIVDDAVVVTGSYNPTGSGDSRNDENLLIIHDQAIAAKFAEEFERVWGIAAP